MSHFTNSNIDPKNAYRKAEDFERAGDRKQALEHLFTVLCAKKMGRLWVPDHEKMMDKFVELCVEYRESRWCKDGLIAYKFLQASAGQPHPLKEVIVRLIKLSEAKAAEARARSDAFALKLDTVEDLEEEQTSEALLTGALTTEGSRERAERETLIPWLRHMIDTYRNVLDTLRGMAQLEGLYHEVAQRAMTFCVQYNRHSEFKRLCKQLREHTTRFFLRAFAEQERASAEGIPREPNARIITVDSITKQMTTRFAALEVCAEMSSWSEGFRIIEDIQLVMDRTRPILTSQLLATYYEKLARIFWVSENYLFHACS